MVEDDDMVEGNMVEDDDMVESNMVEGNVVVEGNKFTDKANSISYAK